MIVTVAPTSPVPVKVGLLIFDAEPHTGPLITGTAGAVVSEEVTATIILAVAKPPLPSETLYGIVAFPEKVLFGVNVIIPEASIFTTPFGTVIV